jgi:glucan phosphoethanolaminetransferase (alkaline phosphatase superfamily)
LVQGFGTIWRVRGFLLLQIAIFLSMVSIHFGLLIGGYRHRSAGTAELVIAAVLVAALLLTWMPAPWSRRPATAAQSFGILGVLVGLFAIALGIGPRTMLDVFLNAGMLLNLIGGLAITLRKP